MQLVSQGEVRVSGLLLLLNVWPWLVQPLWDCRLCGLVVPWHWRVVSLGLHGKGHNLT